MIHLLAHNWGPGPNLGQASFEVGLRSYKEPRGASQPKKFDLIPMAERRDGAITREKNVHRSGAVSPADASELLVPAESHALPAEVQGNLD